MNSDQTPQAQQQFEKWCARFYPESAAENSKSGNTISAIRHSLRKWQGIVEIADGKWPGLEFRHDFIGMETDSGLRRVLHLNSQSCSLCWMFPACDGCVFLKHDSGLTCSDSNDELADEDAPLLDNRPDEGWWNAAKRNPRRMVDALQQILDRELAERQPQLELDLDLDPC